MLLPGVSVLARLARVGRQGALPGEFLRGSETSDDTAVRELREKTGLDASRFHLEQVGVYADRRRDPRDPRVVTCSYLAIVPEAASPVAGSDSADTRWLPVDTVLPSADLLAFDHHESLTEGFSKTSSSPPARTTSPCTSPSQTSMARRRSSSTAWPNAGSRRRADHHGLCARIQSRCEPSDLDRGVPHGTDR